MGCLAGGVVAYGPLSSFGAGIRVIFLRSTAPTPEEMATLCPDFRWEVNLEAGCVRPVAVYAGQSCGSGTNVCVRELDEARVMLKKVAVPGCV